MDGYDYISMDGYGYGCMCAYPGSPGPEQTESQPGWWKSGFARARAGVLEYHHDQIACTPRRIDVIFPAAHAWELPESPRVHTYHAFRETNGLIQVGQILRGLHPE